MCSPPMTRATPPPPREPAQPTSPGKNQPVTGMHCGLRSRAVATEQAASCERHACSRAPDRSQDNPRVIGQKARVRRASAIGRTEDLPVRLRCSNQSDSSGLRISSIKVDSRGGRNTTATTSRVHTHRGLEPTSHPPTSRASSAGATRLRRRLSKIFHSDSADSGFACRFDLTPFTLGGPGTRGSSQPTSCQSPRIQRWRRLTQWRYWPVAPQ